MRLTSENSSEKNKMKTLNKIFLALGITAHGFLPLKSAGQDATPPTKKIYSEKFQINLNDTLQYVAKRNKSEGLKEIYLLNKSASYEEGWLYLPLKGEWHEIGIESKQTSVNLSQQRIEESLKEYKNKCPCVFLRNEIYFIHNHPPSHCRSGYSRGDLISLFNKNLLFKNYEIYGIVIEDKGMIEYSLKPNVNVNEEFFKKNGKDLKMKKVKIFGKLPDNELLKYFDIKITEVN